MQGIYKIINKANGKYYVGSSVNIENRLEGHRKNLEEGRHSNRYLQYAWNKHGGENFTFEAFKEVLGGEKVRLYHEQIYLDEGFALGILYNIATKATGGSGPQSLEARAKRSGRNNGMYGKHHTKKTKAKMGSKISKANMGHEVTKETRTKIGEGNAKAYPAYANIETGEIIPAGRNLLKLCRDCDLNYGVFVTLRLGATIQSKDGWRLA